MSGNEGEGTIIILYSVTYLHTIYGRKNRICNIFSVSPTSTNRMDINYPPTRVLVSAFITALEFLPPPLILCLDDVEEIKVSKLVERSK